MHKQENELILVMILWLWLTGSMANGLRVIALLMAGCIAAALSTAAGLLLVLSTSISHDLMKKIIRPELSDKEEVKQE